MFGGLLGWPAATICGPQAALVISGIPALIGWVMMANAALIVNNYNMFFGVLLAGRMMTGFACGLSIFCVSVSVK